MPLLKRRGHGVFGWLQRLAKRGTGVRGTRGAWMPRSATWPSGPFLGPSAPDPPNGRGSNHKQQNPLEIRRVRHGCTKPNGNPLIVGSNAGGLWSAWTLKRWKVQLRASRWQRYCGHHPQKKVYPSPACWRRSCYRARISGWLCSRQCAGTACLLDRDGPGSPCSSNAVGGAPSISKRVNRSRVSLLFRWAVVVMRSRFFLVSAASRVTAKRYRVFPAVPVVPRYSIFR